MPLSADVIPLIRILADGQFHSGESLGEALGITRAAIWKRLQALTGLGLDVESIKGRGYRLEGGLQLLDEERIKTALSSEARRHLATLFCLQEVDSTNQFLMSADARCGDVCLAERQSAGRGRRGRTWISPYAQNIYLSIRWGYEQGVAALEGLSLAVGVILLEVLRDSFGLAGLNLKWPNDVLLNGKKLGGILIEVGGDLTGECYVVVGVGLNLNMNPHVAKEEINQPWIDLQQASVAVDRNHLCALMISQLLPALKRFPEKGFDLYRERWLQNAAYLNQWVVLSTPADSERGILRGVDHSGSLLVEVEAGVRVFCGGELSVRSA